MDTLPMEDLMITGFLIKFERLINVANIDDLTGPDVSARCPRIPDRQIIRFCERAQAIFAEEQTLMHVTSPIMVVGDIHGHVGDLFRILKDWPIPKERYIFLGDYIDRGNFSLEVATLLVLLKIKFPENVIMIRGNHEFDCVARTAGFYSEVITFYRNEDVYNAFMTMFSYLPLAAVIDEKVLCVHGGLGPTELPLAHLAHIQRPIIEYDDESVASLLWSDPRNDVDTFRTSQRGIGYFYGRDAVLRYLVENRLAMLVRAHEYVTEGVRKWFDGRVVTVFSASNYCGRSNNKSGVLRIDGNNVTEKTYSPLKFLKKSARSYQGSGSQMNISVKLGEVRTPHHKPVIPRGQNRPGTGEVCPISPAFLQAMHVTPTQ